MTTLRRLADAVVSALVAPPCAICHQLLERPLDGAVCEACWLAVRSITPPLCDRCGGPLPSRQVADAGGACFGCHPELTAVERARTIGAYEGALREIVHALKYDQRRSVAQRLSSMMRAAGAELLSGADAVVPVPLHPRRRRARGFNQARLLADGIERPVWDVLQRVRHTTPQVELPAAGRRANVQDAFALARRDTWRRRPGPRLAGAVLVLVDDVATTGATLDACAAILKSAGAREVRALTAARVVFERPDGSSR